MKIIVARNGARDIGKESNQAQTRMRTAACKPVRAKRSVKTAALGTLALLAALVPATTRSAGITRMRVTSPVVLGISPTQVTAGLL